MDAAGEAERRRKRGRERQSDGGRGGGRGRATEEEGAGVTNSTVGDKAKGVARSDSLILDIYSFLFFYGAIHSSSTPAIAEVYTLFYWVRRL